MSGKSKPAATSSKRQKILAALLAIVGATVGIVALLNSYSTPASRWKKRALEQGAPDLVGVTFDSPLSLAPLREPLLVEAYDANLPDDAKIIGVQVGDQQRAYLVQAMVGAGEHVVNDFFNGRAITVLHSERTQFNRVVTKTDATKSLSINVHSVMDGELHVEYRGRHYAVDDPKFPLEDWKFELTRWKDWVGRFPKTLAYTESPDFEQQSPSDLERMRPGPVTNWPVHKRTVKISAENQVAFRLRSPNGWKLTSKEQSLRIDVPNEQEKSTSSIEVQVKSIPADSVPQQYLAAAYDPDQQAKKLAGFKLKSSESINVGNYPARQVVAHFQQADQSWAEIVVDVWTQRAGFTLRGAGPLAEIQRWQPVVREIAKSLQLAETK